MVLPEHLEKPPDRAAVLLVDDDPTVLRALKLILEPEYRTYSALTATEAVGEFRRLHPQIVVLDYKLPDFDGLEALKQIREFDENALVIMITGYGSQQTKSDCARLGAVDFLAKPFDFAELKSRVDNLVDQRPSLDHDVDSKEDFELVTKACSEFIHDVSNPLSAISMLTEMLKSKLRARELSRSEMTETIGTISDYSTFISALVEQWRAFTDAKALATARCSVASIVDLAVRLVAPKIDENRVNLSLDLRHASEEVLVSRFAIARVLMNLLVNSIEAGSLRSQVTIGIATERSGNSIDIRIWDNCGGIAVEPLDRVFEPGFTTKSSGTGLGLAISRSIVERAGGRIDVALRNGGTQFTTTLPLAGVRSATLS